MCRFDILIRVAVALGLTALGAGACQPEEDPPVPFAGSTGTLPNNDPGTPTPDPTPDPTPEQVEETAGDLLGFVAATDRRPMVGMDIRITGPEGFDETTVTVEGGHFEFLDVPFGEITIEIVPEDFVPVKRALKHSVESSNHFFEFLLHRVTKGFFDSEQGGTVNADGDSKVTVPAGGYVHRETGDPLTGALEVRVAYYDPTDPRDVRAAPPLYRLSPDEEGTRLVSLGMVDVELFIDDQPAQLGEGLTATLNLPLDRVDGLVGGASAIPAWYYDTEQGLWIREGQGQVTNDQRWIAEVGHFTTWNADYTDTDDCDDPAVLDMRQCGSDVGACRPGLYRCLTSGNYLTLFDGRSGESAICDGSTGPSPETCNGQDDDCDGNADETFPGQGDACYTGAEATRGVGTCTEGVKACLGGGPALDGNHTCENQTLPATEACDGVDGDCDGIADEIDGDACGPNADCRIPEGGTELECVVRQ